MSEIRAKNIKILSSLKTYQYLDEISVDIYDFPQYSNQWLYGGPVSLRMFIPYLEKSKYGISTRIGKDNNDKKDIDLNSDDFLENFILVLESSHGFRLGLTRFASVKKKLIRTIKINQLLHNE